MHQCNQECSRAWWEGYNSRMGSNNWNKPDPPWQESGFWGGGIEPDQNDLDRIACRSTQYRAGWKEADNKKQKGK